MRWVASLNVCFVQIWIGRIAASLMEILDQQERADAELDFWIVAADHGTCRGRIDPDHMGSDRGAGLKAGDDTCVPVCRLHHGQRHDHAGFFSDWGGIERERFAAEGIAWTRRAWEQRDERR
jgi:hypothetical protein